MKKEEFSDVFGAIKEEYVKEARINTKASKKSAWVKWGAIAASLCIAIGLGVFAMQGGMFFNENTDTTMNDDSVASGFILNDIMYFPIGFEERKEYGLIDESEKGLTKENAYVITKDDLGGLMGTVTLPEKNGEIEVLVYHFSKYPTYNSICVVEFPDGVYEFYTSDGMFLPDESLKTFDQILNAYEMPGSVTEIHIMTDWETEPETVITDRKVINSVCELLRGKVNVGLEEHERLFAQLWYDTYGNEDVYFDEKEGFVKFKTGPVDVGEPEIYTDGEGNSVAVYPDENSESEEDEIYEKAREIWDKGEKIISFKTDTGFKLDMLFKPSIKTVSGNGYYKLSDEEIAEFERLLEID